MNLIHILDHWSKTRSGLEDSTFLFLKCSWDGYQAEMALIPDKKGGLPIIEKGYNKFDPILYKYKKIV